MRELVEKQTPYEGWVLVVVVLSLGVLAYARSTEYRRFISMFQAYFDTRYFREVIREEGVIGNTSTVLLLINGILQLGLFSNAFLNQFSIESGFLTYLTIVGFILVWYVLKGAVQKVLGVVTEASDEMGSSTYLSVFHVIVLGIFLTAVNIGYYFFPDSWSIDVNVFEYSGTVKVALIIGVVISMGLYAFKLYAASAQSSGIKISWYYIIAYLCTLEILPLLIVFQLISVRF